MIIINNERRLKEYLAGVQTGILSRTGELIECDTICIRNVHFNKRLLDRLSHVVSFRKNFVFVDCVIGVGRGYRAEGAISLRIRNSARFIRCRFSKGIIRFCEEDYERAYIRQDIGISFVNCKGSKGSDITFAGNFCSITVIDSRFDSLSVSVLVAYRSRCLNVVNSKIKNLRLRGDEMIQGKEFSLGRDSLYIFNSKIHELELYNCNCGRISTLDGESITFNSLNDKGINHLTGRLVRYTSGEERDEELFL